MTESHKNADRFRGFAGLYNATRPSCPKYVVDVLTRYLGRRPQTVVDMGCGTGLSTFIWHGTADKIIGVEPSEDMIAQAIDGAKRVPNVEFVRAFSDNTGLESGMTDIVTCSQSFHWMEPVSTLREVNRLLKPGGVFAAYDYDGSPVCGTEVELAQQALFENVSLIENDRAEHKETFTRYPKESHLENIWKSGHFRFAREIVFANTEHSDAERFFTGGALSFGGTQAILKKNPSLIENELAAFRAAVDKFFGDKVLPIEFCYRLRLGVAAL